MRVLRRSYSKVPEIKDDIEYATSWWKWWGDFSLSGVSATLKVISFREEVETGTNFASLGKTAF